MTCLDSNTRKKSNSLILHIIKLKCTWSKIWQKFNKKKKGDKDNLYEMTFFKFSDLKIHNITTCFHQVVGVNKNPFQADLRMQSRLNLQIGYQWKNNI